MLEVVGLLIGAGIGGTGYALYRKFSTENINTILKTETKALLKEYKLWKPLQKGELLCSVCGEVMTIDNIGVLQVEETHKKIIFVCEECSRGVSVPPIEQLHPLTVEATR